MVAVGDRVQLSPGKGGQLPREGVITGVTGALLRVRWSSGEESTIIPGAGTLAVVGKARKTTAKKSVAPTPPSKKLSAKKALPKAAQKKAASQKKVPSPKSATAKAKVKRSTAKTKKSATRSR